MSFLIVILYIIFSKNVNIIIILYVQYVCMCVYIVMHNLFIIFDFSFLNVNNTTTTTNNNNNSNNFSSNKKKKKKIKKKMLYENSQTQQNYKIYVCVNKHWIHDSENASPMVWPRHSRGPAQRMPKAGVLWRAGRHQRRPNKRLKDNLKSHLNWTDPNPKQLELAASDRTSWRARTNKAATVFEEDRHHHHHHHHLERRHRAQTTGEPCPLHNRLCASAFGVRRPTRTHRWLRKASTPERLPGRIVSFNVPVAQWESIVSAAQKVVGSIPREHILTKNV